MKTAAEDFITAGEAVEYFAILTQAETFESLSTQSQATATVKLGFLNSSYNVIVGTSLELIDAAAQQICTVWRNTIYGDNSDQGFIDSFTKKLVDIQAAIQGNKLPVFYDETNNSDEYGLAIKGISGSLLGKKFNIAQGSLSYPATYSNSESVQRINFIPGKGSNFVYVQISCKRVGTY